MSDCDYCGTDALVYELNPSRGGTVHRCLECLAIEQGQQQFGLPFEAWLDRDDIDPVDHEDAPEFEPYDLTEADYHRARAWFRILARIKDDNPILKRDPDALGAIYEDTRTFLTNLMGADAHKRPSELEADDA
jgi:hypothetical protein